MFLFMGMYVFSYWDVLPILETFIIIYITFVGAGYVNPLLSQRT